MTEIPVEVGITSFAETTPDPATGAVTGHGVRLREVIEEIVLADQTGLDVYGLGEHHRPDFAASAPAVVLAGAATRTSRIRLSSAVSVLSSDDPVRVFQQFATLDLISGGRAEIMAGRGSFIESFPLFGYALEDYEELFAEKLELLLAIRERERVTWSGRHRAPIEDRGVYPRPAQDPLPVWVAVGGTPRSVVRAGLLGLPLALAIIGGQPERFAPLVALYRDAARQGGHDPEALPIGVHVHGWIAETSQRASEEFYGPYAYVMSMIGRERGWPPFTRAAYEAALGPGGHLAVGSAEQVAEKLLAQMEVLGHRRVLLHLPVGTMPHDRVMQAIERLGAEVAPVLRREGGRPARAA